MSHTDHALFGPDHLAKVVAPDRLLLAMGSRCASSVLGMGSLLLWMAATTAHAQLAGAIPAGGSATSPIAAVLVQKKVVKNSDGTEKLDDASKVKPGDVIEYKVTYTNNSDKPVADLVANLPIPEGLEYQASSAKPGAVQAKLATADGKFGAEPLMRTLAGKTEPVPYNAYRQVRWTLGQLAAHGSTAVTARARVEEVIPELPKLVNSAQTLTQPSSANR